MASTGCSNKKANFPPNKMASTGCSNKKANFPPLTLGAFEIRRAPNVKIGGKFAFLIGHLVYSGQFMVEILRLRLGPDFRFTSHAHFTLWIFRRRN